MTVLIYAGAEVGSNRTLLTDMGVKRMGISYARIVARGLPKGKEWLVSERFPDDVEVYLYPGVSELKDKPDEEIQTLYKGYQHFLDNNYDRLSFYTEFDAPQFDETARERSRHESDSDRMVVIWTPDQTMAELMRLSEEYGDVAIPYPSVSEVPTLAGVTAMLSREHGTRFHALASSKPDQLYGVNFTTATTLSWASPMMRGETIVWDGHNLKRYPKDMKDQARQRSKTVIDQAGMDYALIMADDHKETTKLAVWSFQRLEETMSAVQNVGNSVDVASEKLNNEVADVDSSPNPRRKLKPRNPDEMMVLPVVSVTYEDTVEIDKDGRPIIRSLPMVSTHGQSLRQCNTCFLAASCPAFAKDSACAFNFPVEVRTKEQLKALLQSVIEMQAARVAFGRFAEESNGGYPDPNVSQEMDRLFKLVESLKRLEENKDFVRLTVERQSGAGVLSSIFGDKAQQLRELPEALGQQQTDNIIQGIIDGQQ